MADYKLQEGREGQAIGVLHTPTGKSIPNDPINNDWIKYLAWVDDGNTPDPAD